MRGPLSYVALALVALTAVAVFSLAPTAHAQPEITEASPQQGDVLQTLPEFLHLCFSEPVKTEQSTWRFNVKTPDGRFLGLRIVFDTAGECVDVYPGVSQPAPQGIWTFDWLVHSQSDGSEGSGVINFQLGELQPGETPLERPEIRSPDNTDDNGGNGASTLLLVLVGGGAAIIIVAAAGFVLSRRRARRT